MTTVTSRTTRPDRSTRAAQGKAARAHTPLAAHADLDLARGRDPIGLLLDQARTRAAELVPIRHGRMLATPFSYYRGAALPMAADLANTPVCGLRAQLCGDAHLANFGAFAAPDRRLVFDINDFDETLPGPFEWDVKRLAASFAIAGRHNGLNRRDRHRALITLTETYRTTMRQFSRQSIMDVWYARLDVDDAIAEYGPQIRPKAWREVRRMVARAYHHDSRQLLSSLTTVVDGERHIISRPPTIVPIEDLSSGVESDQIYRQIRAVLNRYRRSLPADRQHLFEQFDVIRVAHKVVGVGSVGQRAWAVLIDAGDDPLFLQAKEAQPSILADYCGHSRYRNQGERVVAGQHLMQAASDIFLGWTHNVGPDGVDRDFYVRQLRDWKLSFPIDRMRRDGLTIYAKLCGWTLARAHARSGDRFAIGAYLGKSATFDHAIAEFAEAYADLNDRDHAAFADAVRRGRVAAVTGV